MFNWISDFEFTPLLISNAVGVFDIALLGFYTPETGSRWLLLFAWNHGRTNKEPRCWIEFGWMDKPLYIG